MSAIQFFKKNLSLIRMQGLIRKEFTLILRDKGTIAMLVIMPVMLLIVFGFAIDLDPKHLPTAVVSYDNSPLTRSLISTLNSSRYFHVVETTKDLHSIQQKLQTGAVSFALVIPPNFTHKYIRHENPELLMEFDASDPGSSASAAGHMQPILDSALNEFNQRGLAVGTSHATPLSVHLISHRMYNETNQSAFNVVPGLIGVLLTMTMVLLTSTAITAEFESGTMELLLSTPLAPTEIILGKVIPYVLLGYLQLTCILIFGKVLINVPMEGNLLLLYFAAAPFIIANLMVGMIFSTLATTPMQAMQMSMFFQLPSIFLSGYVFSFYGMPLWAQKIGFCLPMTYFMRITRGVMLKGNAWHQIIPNIFPIMLIALVLIIITRLVFRRTLD